MKRREKVLPVPAVSQLERELIRVEDWQRRGRAIRSTLLILAAVSSVAVLTAILWLPVLRVVGTSMTPTLREGQIVVSQKGTRFATGDIIAFRYNNEVLVKRVIAGAGQWVSIYEDGQVTVDGEPIEEPYLTDPAVGICDISLPYQVPDGRYFVMGDHRSTSIDSRSQTVGCVSRDQVVGRIVFCLWPLSQFGPVAHGSGPGEGA